GRLRQFPEPAGLERPAARTARLRAPRRGRRGLLRRRREPGRNLERRPPSGRAGTAREPVRRAARRRLDELRRLVPDRRDRGAGAGGTRRSAMTVRANALLTLALIAAILLALLLGSVPLSPGRILGALGLQGN